MKKLILLFAILLFATGVEAQSVNSFCDFLTYRHFKYSQTYYLTVEDVQYAIAYDSIKGRTGLYDIDYDILERDLYLYRKDGNKWTIVSDVIKTDYWKIENGVESYDYYKENQEGSSDLKDLLGDIGGYSFIKLTKEGHIYIRMLNFYGVDGVDEVSNHRWIGIILKSQGDGTYRKYSPYNPKIRMKAIT